jgi:hypothetical protein
MLLSDGLGTKTPHHKHSIVVDGQTYIEGMHVDKARIHGASAVLAEMVSLC